jgi:APA family basic amino acid/polyamine antiporter
MWLVETPQQIDFLPDSDNTALLFTSAFATSLIYVNYAYSGWNAATYISSELREPQQSLPRILLVGTLSVTICYVLLNYVFLYTTPVEAMQGQVEIGVISAKYIFGDTGALIMGTVMSLLLVSTVSAMTIAGPRVLQVIGEDFSVFQWLAKTNEDKIPSRAIIFQSVLALFFVITASFESILIFAGFALALNNFFAVAGVFVSRLRQPEIERPYKTWLYPLPPIIFLSITIWTLVFLLIERPMESLSSLGIISLGVLFYFLSQHWSTN